MVGCVGKKDPGGGGLCGGGTPCRGAGVRVGKCCYGAVGVHCQVGAGVGGGFEGDALGGIEGSV